MHSVAPSAVKEVYKRIVAELRKVILVVATQNPIEQEGTYPLPEAQIDRRFQLLLRLPRRVTDLRGEMR